MQETVLLILCSLSGTISKTLPNNVSNLVVDSKLSDAPHITKQITNDSHILQTVPTKKTIFTLDQVKHSLESSTDETTARVLQKIHRTITRSKDAVWATISLTFICILLVLSVAQSQMWKNYKPPESQGVPLPNFNEKVLFEDVMKHKVKTLKQFFKKKPKKKEPDSTELECLLQDSSDDESSSIPNA